MEKITDIIIKINETSGTIQEVAIKTSEGNLFNVEDLGDVADRIDFARGIFGIHFNVINSKNVNCGNLTNFLTEGLTNRESNANYLLQEMASRDGVAYAKRTKYIKNFDKISRAASAGLNLVNSIIEIGKAIDNYNSDVADDEKQIAVAKMFHGILDISSTVTEFIPGLMDDLVSTTLSTAAQTLETGIAVIGDYVNRLMALEEELEEISSDEQYTLEGMEVICEVAEAFKPFLDSDVLAIAQGYNNQLSEFKSAVNTYESNKGVDINGDGEIGGEPYDPDKHGSGDDSDNGNENGGGEEAEEQFNNGERSRVDPIVLDLNNDGFNPTSLKNGVNFDLDANGMAERINWIQNDDAILAYDKNEDGIINNGTEVFGDNTILENGKKAVNGFEALSEFDSNKDGIINAEDERFNQLFVWQDSNSNGISEESELKTIDEIGIESININYSNLNSNTASGTVLGNVGSFIFKDGSTSRMAEYWVLSQKFNTVDKNPIDIPDEIAELPNVNGMGNVYSLHKAMTLDTTGRLIIL